jgi:hypothetical protein
MCVFVWPMPGCVCVCVCVCLCVVCMCMGTCEHVVVVVCVSTSFISLICLLSPPTISYVASGTASTRIKLTRGSTYIDQGVRTCTCETNGFSYASDATTLPCPHKHIHFSLDLSLTLFLPFLKSPRCLHCTTHLGRQHLVKLVRVIAQRHPRA